MDSTVILSVLLTLVLVGWGWLSLPSIRLRLLFIAAVLLITSYEFVPTPETWEAGVYLWARHAPTYVGEFVLYRFFVNFGKVYFEEDEAAIKKPLTPNLIMVPIAVPAGLVIFGETSNLFNFVTEAGLPHIIVLPLFVLIYGLISVRFGLSKSRYKSSLNWFVAGLCFWAMIHISEFMLESQKIGGALNGHVEQIEKIWLTLGIVAFIIGLQKLKAKPTAKPSII